MFSFIKWFQDLSSKIKKNKGLWFTTLSILSTSGILITMTLIHQLTNSVAKETYLEERRIDLQLVDALLAKHYDKLLSFSATFSADKDVIKYFKKKNEKNLQDRLNTIISTVNNVTTDSIQSTYYYAENQKKNISKNEKFAQIVIDSKQNISGVVINSDGVKIIAIIPIIENNQTLGAL